MVLEAKRTFEGARQEHARTEIPAIATTKSKPFSCMPLACTLLGVICLRAR